MSRMTGARVFRFAGSGSSKNSSSWTGELCDLADLFSRRCREAVEAEGLEPRCFKAECVKNLVQITTPPSFDPKDPANNNLAPAFRWVASTAQ